MSIIVTENLLNSVKEIAKKAGNAILDIYEKSQDFSVEYKKDGSPLTVADKVANDIITEELSKLTPDSYVLSEEGTDISYSQRANWLHYWLVDPLDGTKEFLQKTGNFTVNIALIEKHHSVLGVVYVPVTGCCYFAARNIGAFKEDAEKNSQVIHVQSVLPDKIRVVASRLHGGEQLASGLEKMKKYEIKRVGSSLKFCLIAEGAADFYPRLGLTSEWDTAAAQCILEQAGGSVIDLYGLPLQYNTRDSLLNPYFLAVGDKNYPWVSYFSNV